LLYAACFAVAASAFFAGQAALAQEESGPKPADIASVLDSMIPAFWGIEKVSVKASANRGDAVQPEWAQRFEALVSVKTPLYREVETIPTDEAVTLHPFNELVQTLSAESTRILHGVATSTQYAGAWNIEIELENNVDRLGLPLDFFNMPTVVRNSPEYSELTTALSDAAKTAFLARFKAEMERLRQTHVSQVEALKADQQAEEAALARATADRKARAEAASQSWQKQQADARARHAARMERLRQTHASQVEALKADQQAEEAALARAAADRKAQAEAASQSWQQQQADARARHAAQMERLRQTHASQIETLEAAHKEEIDLIETGLEVKAAQLRAKTADLLEIERLTYENDEAAQAVTEAAAASYRKSRDRRRALVKQIGSDLALEETTEKRLAIFDAALATENELVIESAFEAALTSDDEVLRLHAISAALAQDDAGRRRRAMDIALGDKASPKLRRAGLARLVASGDVEKSGLSYTRLSPVRIRN